MDDIKICSKCKTVTSKTKLHTDVGQRDGYWPVRIVLINILVIIQKKEIYVKKKQKLKGF